MPNAIATPTMPTAIILSRRRDISLAAWAHSYPPPNNFGVNLPYRKLRKCCIAYGAPAPMEAAYGLPGW